MHNLYFRNEYRNVTIFVMKRIKCAHCKERFPPPNRGWRPRYCSAACRQKAYRKRAANPHRSMLRVLRSDLYAIKDSSARGRGAVRVLEELGYEVFLKERLGPRRKTRERHLQVVDSSKREDD